MKHFKAKPILTELGQIIPEIDAKRNDGKRCNSGSMSFGTEVGEGTVGIGGKIEHFRVISSGLSLVIVAESGRRFVTKLDALIEHAAKHGLFDSSLRFLPDTSPDQE